MSGYLRGVVLPEKERKRVIEILNELLASSIDLTTQVKHAQWNVKGLHRESRAAIFAEIAERARTHSDRIAERIAMLGGIARGTGKMAIESSDLPEFDEDMVGGNACVQFVTRLLLLEDEELRDAIEECEELDPITENLLEQVALEVERDAWRLHAHLQPAHHVREAEAETARPVQS